MKFLSEVPDLEVYIPRIGVTAVFVAGKYETERQDVIAALARHPMVAIDDSGSSPAAYHEVPVRARRAGNDPSPLNIDLRGAVAGKDAIGVDGKPLPLPVESDSALAGSELAYGGLPSIAAMLTATPQSKPVSVSVGSGYTTYSDANEKAVSQLASPSTSVKVKHRGSEKDPRIDSSGAPFLDLFNSSAQHVGSGGIHGTPNAWGPTGTVTFHAFGIRLATGKDSFEITMKDTSGSQYLVVWVDGRPHVDPYTPQLVSPGFGADGNYHPVRIAGLTPGVHEIGIEMVNGTFGGVRFDLGGTLFPSQYATAPMVAIMGDSFTVPHQSQWTSIGQPMWSWPVRAARRLGMRLQLSGTGGTSFKNDNSGSNFKYADRYATEIQAFRPTRGYAAVVLQGSINAQSIAGTNQERDEAIALINTIKADNPGVPVVITSPMQPSLADATANANNLLLRDEYQAAATSTSIPLLDALVTGQELFSGTGSVDAPAGNGNADVMAWGDKRHPAPQGADAIAKFVAQRVAREVQAGTGVTPVNVAGRRRRIPIFTFEGEMTALTAQTYILTKDGPIAAAASGSAKGMRHLDIADEALTALLTKMRLKATLATNGTAAGVNFTFNLAAAGALGGQSASAPGLAVASNQGVSTTFTTPAINTKLIQTSGDQPFPTTATYYVITVTPSGSMAANSFIEYSVECTARNV